MNLQKEKLQRLWITHVSAIGPYLKVCGQVKPMIDLPQRLKEEVLPRCKAMHNVWSITKKKEHLTVDRIYLVKSINRSTKLGDSELLRARMIRSIETLSPPAILLVEVDFIDMGYRKIVECEELLIAPLDHKLTRMPALGSQFILLGMIADMTSFELEDILRLIANQTLSIKVEMEIKGHKFITLQWKGWDFAEFLISQRKIGSPVNKYLQRDNFLQVLKEEHQDNMEISSNMISQNENNNDTQNSNKNIDYKIKGNSHNRPIANNFRCTGGHTETSRLDEAKSIIQKFQKEQQRQFLRQQLLQQEEKAFCISPNIEKKFKQMQLKCPTAMVASPTGSVSSQPNNYTIENSPTSLKCLTGYKVDKLTIGCSYDVFVSFVENGPYIFSVQLMTAQHELTKMTNQIESTHLQNIKGNLTIGMACIARSSENGQLYRALVVNVEKNAAQVAYIDYGKFERVKKSDLHEIPAEFRDQRAFALPFALAGLKSLEPINDSLKKTFKEMVIYKTCKLKVLPPEGPPGFQNCELYMQNKNILQALRDIQKSRLVYPNAAPLMNNDIVEVRFIDTPRSFFVQNIANINEFEQLMDDMFCHYNSNQINPQYIDVGAAYVVKTDADWYRAEVIQINKKAITVRLVDFGYERTVTKDLLISIDEKHLKMPRQAVHCCLKDFENNELAIKDFSITQFEMLAEGSNNHSRRSFNIKVFCIRPDNLHIVNLFTKEINVMKILYRLSLPLKQYLSRKYDAFNTDEFHIKSEFKTKEHDQTSNIQSRTSSSNIVVEQSTSQRLAGDLEKKPSSVGISNTNHERSNADDTKKQRPYQQQKELDQHHKIDQLQKDLHSSNFESTDLQNDKNISQPMKNASSSLAHCNSLDQKENDAYSHNSLSFQKEHQSEYSQNIAKRSWSLSERSKDSKYVLKIGNNKTFSPASAWPKKIEYTTLDYAFPQDELQLPLKEEVTIFWWSSPHQFFTHRKSRDSAFANLMHNIQTFYKNKPLLQLQLKIGSYVIALLREKNIFYRSRIIACNPMQRTYDVYFVDYGSQNTVTVDDIWPVECRFADFPIMGYYCSLGNIISNYDHFYIMERLEKYLPTGSKIICEYKRKRKDNLYYVNVWVNNLSLHRKLKFDKIITDIHPNISIELLVGQQIRAQIIHIKDILNFKILIEGFHSPLLSSFDNVRLTKSHRDIVYKFKQYYNGKYCLVNIKEVNDNNVILLRPVFPLFNEKPIVHICHYPHIFHTFKGTVADISSPHRIFVHKPMVKDKVNQLIDDMYNYYENEGSYLSSFDVGEFCAAKSEIDSNWYRARITESKEDIETTDCIEVHLVDYGNSERLKRNHLKKLEKRFYEEQCVYATEVNLPLRLTSSKYSSKRLQEKSEAVVEELWSYLGDKTITVNVIEFRRNHLMGEIIVDEDKNMLDILIEKKLVKGRDLNYMSKLLDNDKSNIIEFIDTVDLTLDDEDEKEDEDQDQDETSKGEYKEMKSQKFTTQRNKDILDTSRARFEENSSSQVEFQTLPEQLLETRERSENSALEQPEEQLLRTRYSCESQALDILYKKISETIKLFEESFDDN